MKNYFFQRQWISNQKYCFPLPLLYELKTSQTLTDVCFIHHWILMRQSCCLKVTYLCIIYLRSLGHYEVGLHTIRCHLFHNQHLCKHGLWTHAQCLKWQHFYHKCHCFVGYCHMFTIKHYNTLIYFPDQNFNFSNPPLCNFDLRWQILIWSYLIDNTFTEITVPLPYTL